MEIHTRAKGNLAIAMVFLGLVFVILLTLYIPAWQEVTPSQEIQHGGKGWAAIAVMIDNLGNNYPTPIPTEGP
jgi:hypothetical protein